MPINSSIPNGSVPTEKIHACIPAATTWYLLRCIQSIKTTAPDLPVTVLADGTDFDTIVPDTLEKISSLQGITVARTGRRRGKAKSVNRFWQAGQYQGKEYFLNIDADVEFIKPGWLDQLIAIASYADLAFLYMSQHSGCEDDEAANPISADFAPGAVWCLPVRTLDRFGMLYDACGPYGHVDTEYSARVRAADGTLIAPSGVYANHLDSAPKARRNAAQLEYGRWKTRIRAASKTIAETRIEALQQKKEVPFW